jgi:hypothetical protein
MPRFAAESTLYQTKGYYGTLGCLGQFENYRAIFCRNEVSPSVQILDPRTACILVCEAKAIICRRLCNAAPLPARAQCFRGCEEDRQKCLAECPPAGGGGGSFGGGGASGDWPSGATCGSEYCRPDEQCCFNSFCKPKERECDAPGGTACRIDKPPYLIHCDPPIFVDGEPKAVERCCPYRGCYPITQHCCPTYPGGAATEGCGDPTVRNVCCLPGKCDRRTGSCRSA